MGGRRRRSTSVTRDFRPGHLFWMPAGATWLNHDKPRPFSLATACVAGSIGTLVYGSTQSTEKIAGAVCIEVSPVREGVNRNGLHTSTYFYPGTLLPIQHRHLPAHSGHIARSLEELRAALRLALGIGLGSCRTAGAPSGSLRGRIVVLRPETARAIGASFALVLTEPQYSIQANYQIILPIFADPPLGPGAYDLVLSRGEWSGFLAVAATRIVLPVPTTLSVWHRQHIQRETEYVLDEESLAEIDRHLCAYFSLPPAEQGT
jgi:hypothetical protein